MALDYVKTSREILNAVGGADNISSAVHCMTRLRLVLKDESKADDAAVEAIKGVKSVIKQGGQYQVVIGNEVSNLFKEFQKLGNFGEGTAEAVKPEGNPVQRMFGFISGCMTPLLPAMLGTGMIKVLLTLLVNFGVMSEEGPIYILLYNMADAFFYFLPIFLSVTIAQKMKRSIPLFMVIGAMLVSPTIINLLANGTEAVPLGTFLGLPCTYIFGVIPVIQTTYSSSVLPILLMAPIMKWTEDFADRISPNVVKAFLKPMIFLLICTPIAFVVVGPLGAVVGNLVAAVFSAMYNTVPWLTVAIISAAMPFIVMTGMHYALIPLAVNNLAVLGYDVIVGITMFCSNIAQGGAVLGVAAKTKDTDLRSEGLASGISATIAGITEPALYGINMRLGRPLINAVIGAGLAGLWCGITGVKGYVMGGSPSLLAVVTFINPNPAEGENPMLGLVFGIIGALIALVVPFVLTLLTHKEEAGNEETVTVNQMSAVAAEEPQEVSAGSVKDFTIAAPMKGKAIAIADIPDQVFASGALGEGIAIIPEDGKVYAPFDGTVTGTMDSGHAIGLESNNGVEVLIHVGLETVGLNGEPFTYKVKEGDKIRKGDLLMTADLEMIKAKGCEIHTPVVITNSDDFDSVSISVADKSGAVSAGDVILKVN